MGIVLNEYEKVIQNEKSKKKKMSDEEINRKYENGEQRIVTEQGAFKLELIPSIFSKKKYNLRPEFQRRITWDVKKRSKLIESFIMNIPVPPVFLYEDTYSSYVVMDGLQRISAIIDFYNDSYKLTGLEEWSELNGKKYSELPAKIQEGIDRRQLTVITLLKESAMDSYSAEKMKKMVFERLNTGGVQLQDQEIRNALYSGSFNDNCFSLSENKIFKKLWWLIGICGEDESELQSLDADDNLMAAKNKLYRRMYDVELVLRYFAMRNVDNYSGKLSKFLDTYLEHANKYSENQINEINSEFINAINMADSLFGDKAFCIFRDANSKWSNPQNMIYDALMLALSDDKIFGCKFSTDIERNTKRLEDFYIRYAESFNGKKQSKQDIIMRANLFVELLKNEMVDS